jgi:hypothetical protein
LAEGRRRIGYLANRAAQFDRKLDDGQPNIGDVIGLGDVPTAQMSMASTTRASEQRNCNLLIRVQS